MKIPWENEKDDEGNAFMVFNDKWMKFMGDDGRFYLTDVTARTPFGEGETDAEMLDNFISRMEAFRDKIAFSIAEARTLLFQLKKEG